ncbi:YugN-like family protein [Thermicanus aegyptius]|uniref:YugN-like family protein n=1 Tax=Thermicanus aegyptius TaxID=94009 RepID=UPI0003FD7795|nr:YugN-like family protein [Thermicanus aegyptius]
MIEIPSRLEGKTFLLDTLEEKLKPLGFTIGGNWDYDQGLFDYKLAGEAGGYLFLRIPFKAVKEQLDSYGTVVETGTPFLLSHKFKAGPDDRSEIGVLSAAINQFSEPQDPDAAVPEKYIPVGRRLVHDLELILLED